MSLYRYLLTKQQRHNNIAKMCSNRSMTLTVDKIQCVDRLFESHAYESVLKRENTRTIIALAFLILQLYRWNSIRLRTKINTSLHRQNLC
jgi:hypothetical protein